MTGNAPHPAISISALDKWFGAFQALKQIDLHVMRGEKIVVCGPSGSGKSTLIRCINRLEPHDGGHIVVNGIDVDEMDRVSTDSSVRREMLGLTVDDFVIGCVSRWDPVKRFEILLQALALAARAGDLEAEIRDAVCLEGGGYARQEAEVLFGH